MSKQVRFRRGTTAQHSVFTGPAGEITVDTDKKQIVVQDGVTAGGIPVARADRPRGFTKVEYWSTSGTYSIVGKTDLKRIRVWAYGGGGGGNSGSQGSGGGEGGQGVVTIEVGSLSSTTAVTIGGGGGSNGGGGTTSFGTFITATGGGAGGDANTGSNPGSVSGTGVLNLGAQAGMSGINMGTGYGRGGGVGGGAYGQAGKAFVGGGGSAGGYSGGNGGIMVEEIYGYV